MAPIVMAVWLVAAMQTDTSVVVVDVDVVDVVRGGVLRDRAVHMRGGVFVTVAEAEGYAVPPGATVIRGRGRSWCPVWSTHTRTCTMPSACCCCWRTV